MLLLIQRMRFSTYHRYNPYNHEMIYQGRNLYSMEMSKIIDASEEAQQKWQNRSIGKRVELIQSFLGALEHHKLRLSILVTQAIGKPITQSLREIDTSLYVSRRLLQQAIAFRESIVMERGREQFVSWEPRGVVLQFSTWNWPILYTLVKLIPALVSGNSVILKHSYMTPQVGIEIQSLFEGLGVNNLVQNIEVSNSDLRDLISNPKIGYISYMGDYNTGMKIYEDASFQSLKDCTLRFNGKDGAYIRGDADLVQASRIIMESAFENAGQSDLAVKRIYVNTRKYDEFNEIFSQQVKNTYQPGDPMLDSTNLGPLAEPEESIKLSRLIEDAVIQGSRVLCGGTETWDPKYPHTIFFQPTVIADAENDMDVMQEECLGPIVTVSEVQDDEEAIRLLNDSKYGNAVSIFTRSKDAFNQVANRLDVGQVYGNHCNYYDCVEMPHDPRKQSGRGVFLSSSTFYEYVQPKSHNYRISLK